MNEKKGDLPPLRLRHAKVGQTVVLVGHGKRIVLLTTDRRYGHFTGMKASLCHPLDREGWAFGEDGWKQEERK